MQNWLGLFLILNFANASFAQVPDCHVRAGSLPFAERSVGSADPKNPIQHIIVLMQENHSFDNYFGKLNLPEYYGNEVDGLDDGMTNPSLSGKSVQVYHERNLCSQDPEHGWNAIHLAWNHGRQDGFVQISGPKAMGYFDQNDIPFYYDLANKFAIADHYFCSALTQTLPNRYFLYAGTSFGHISSDIPRPLIDFHQKTIFDLLDQHHIKWRYYKNGFGYLALFQPLFLWNLSKMKPVSRFAVDLANGDLPQVVFIDGNAYKEDEHPHANIQEGQAFAAARIHELSQSQYWKNSVFFLTYDEGGGFFDHIAPPRACVPDKHKPKLEPQSQDGEFDNLGFRVPFVVVSPYARHHFVSHQVYDHTSILKFIEEKYNLPALSARDANAVAPNEMFDFAHPNFDVKPDRGLAKITESCK